MNATVIHKSATAVFPPIQCSTCLWERKLLPLMDTNMCQSQNMLHVWIWGCRVIWWSVFSLHKKPSDPIVCWKPFCAVSACGLFPCCSLAFYCLKKCRLEYSLPFSLSNLNQIEQVQKITEKLRLRKVHIYNRRHCLCLSDCVTKKEVLSKWASMIMCSFCPFQFCCHCISSHLSISLFWCES